MNITKGFKVLRSDMTAWRNNFKYETGVEYTMNDTPIPRKRGFHFCRELKGVASYYFQSTARVFEVEAYGSVADGRNVSCTNHIKLIREITDEVNSREDFRRYVIEDGFGYTIRYFENPSEELQLQAVRLNGGAIVWIKNPSEQVQLAAVNEDGTAIQFIANPSDDVKLAAVQSNYAAYHYIKNPSEEVQLCAVRQSAFAIDLINNPSEKVKLHAKRLHA